MLFVFFQLGKSKIKKITFALVKRKIAIKKKVITASQEIVFVHAAELHNHTSGNHIFCAF